ncbi:unnamed protein product [Calypogeia fissa]
MVPKDIVVSAQYNLQCSHSKFLGRKEYEPPRYMSVNTAVEQLLEVEESRKEKAYTEGTLAVGMARLGSPDQLIVAGTLKELHDVDFGTPLHCLVITGSVHVMEEEMLNFFKVK